LTYFTKLAALQDVEATDPATAPLPAGVPTASPAPTPVQAATSPEPSDLVNNLNKNFKGALNGKGQDIVNAAYKNGIEPSLFGSIVALETGWGTSDALKKYNNPGGVMDPNSPDQKGFQKFDDISQGLDAMGANLQRNYISKGLTTPGTIGPVYAPVNPDGTPVKNDPNGTNKDWPFEVTDIRRRLGASPGLMN
jgi:hypothetical protein